MFKKKQIERMKFQIEIELLNLKIKRLEERIERLEVLERRTQENGQYQPYSNGPHAPQPPYIVTCTTPVKQIDTYT